MLMYCSKLRRLKLKCCLLILTMQRDGNRLSLESLTWRSKSLNILKKILPFIIGIAICSQLHAEDSLHSLDRSTEDRSTEFSGVTTEKGKTTLKLSVDHYRVKSLYTERNNMGAVIYQDTSSYHESTMQARFTHGVTENWEVGLIIALSDIKSKTTEIIGGNAVNKLQVEGVGNLQLTTAVAKSFNQGDTHLIFEAVAGLPTDTRSQQIVGGATGNIELSAVHYLGSLGIKGLVSRYFGAARDFSDWTKTSTHKFGAHTELAPKLFGSLMFGKSDGVDIGEIILERSLENDKTLEFTFEKDLNGSRDGLYVALGLTYPLN